MTKMAAMHIYGKTPLNLLRYQWTDFHETWYMYVAFGTTAHHNLFKLWPWADHDLFFGQVKFGDLGFSIWKNENSGYLRNFWACDIRVGTHRHLIEP